MLAIDRPRRLNVTIFTSFSFQSHITLGLWRWSIVVILHQIKKPINKLILSLVQLLFGNWHRWDRKNPRLVMKLSDPHATLTCCWRLPGFFLGGGIFQDERKLIVSASLLAPLWTNFPHLSCYHWDYHGVHYHWSYCRKRSRHLVLYQVR